MLFSLAASVLAAGGDASDRLASSLARSTCEAGASPAAIQRAALGVLACNVRTALLALQKGSQSASRRPQVCAIRIPENPLNSRIK